MSLQEKFSRKGAKTLSKNPVRQACLPVGKLCDSASLREIDEYNNVSSMIKPLILK